MCVCGVCACAVSVLGRGGKRAQVTNGNNQQTNKLHPDTAAVPGPLMGRRQDQRLASPPTCSQVTGAARGDTSIRAQRATPNWPRCHPFDARLKCRLQRCLRRSDRSLFRLPPTDSSVCHSPTALSPPPPPPPPRPASQLPTHARSAFASSFSLPPTVTTTCTPSLPPSLALSQCFSSARLSVRVKRVCERSYYCRWWNITALAAAGSQAVAQ